MASRARTGPGMSESDQRARMSALFRLESLDTEPEPVFDDLAELAALIFKTPIAMISLVDSGRRWVKASVGIDLAGSVRGIALCDHTIGSGEVTIVADARQDERFRDSPSVVGPPGIGFYAGAPLVMEDGRSVGTLCVIDVEPREAFAEADQRRLKALAASVSQLLVQRAGAHRDRRLAAKAAEDAELSALAEQAGGVGVWVYDVAARRVTWSDETYRIFGLSPGRGPLHLKDVFPLYAANDAARLAEIVGQSIESATGYEYQAQITRPDGSIRDILSRGSPRRDETGAVVALYGTLQDVTEQKLAAAALRENESRLRSMNWALTAYARSTSALLHTESLEPVVASVCEAIVADDAYALACVALAEPLPSKTIKVVAGSGKAIGYLEGLKLSWSEDEPEGTGPTGRAIRSGQAQIMRDALVEPVYGPWRERGRRFGIRSSVTVPFSKGETILGVLIVYADRPDAFGPQEMDLFQQLGEELAFAISLQADRVRLAASQDAARQAEAAERAARHRLEESEARYRLLAEHVADVIVRYDVSGTIEYVSPSVRQFGHEPDDLVGRDVMSLVKVTDALSTTVRALQTDQPLAGGPENEFQIIRGDGGLVWAQGNPVRIFDDDGVLIGAVTVIRDISERRAMEDELRQKRAEAEAAAKAKAQFLANMSHEIRTPLTGVIGFGGLLKGMDGLPDTARAYTRRIVEGGQVLLSLVDDILDFSRIEAGQVQLDPRPVALGTFFDETVGLLRPEAERKGLTLSVERLGDLPALVRVDGERLRQVLLNLVGNAVKFTTRGSVSVEASYGAAGGVLRVAVTDTGAGIPADQLERLFQRFSQIDESNSRQHGGAGLGLAISKALVERLGGEIGVDSREGCGSTFWFTVLAPATDAAPASGSALDDDHALSPPASCWSMTWR